MTTTPNPAEEDAVDRAEHIDEPAEDEQPLPDEREAAVTVDRVAPEPEDVTLPGDPHFDETNELLTGEDADPPPGAQAG